MEEFSKQMQAWAELSLGPVRLGTVVGAAVTLLVCAGIIRLLRILFHQALSRTKHAQGALGGFLESAFRIVLWAFALLLTADTAGIPMGSLLAGVGVIGLALSLAVQNIISHLFSGVTLLITRPFDVGDFVEISGKMGTVKKVGLFYTVLDTLDNVCISIPNGDVTAAAVSNYSREATRRVDLTFSASYTASTEAVKAAIGEAVAADSRILSEPAPFVGVLSYGNSSIQYVCRVWCRGTEYWDVYFALNERVRESFARAGVEMTYDHLNVHLDR